MKITIISDTHTKHRYCENDLPGGDLLIHAGDFMNSGYNPMDAMEFFQWFDEIENYDFKVFIAGNHDRWMQDKTEESRGILTGYKTIEYLQDDWMTVGDSDPHDPNVKTAKIYGSPWQPEFYNWAFNLPRNGEELKSKWDMIHEDTDILITHGPAWGFLDDVEGNRNVHLGCELLAERIKQIKPKIHICGHIHSGYGHYFDGYTHYFNASVLNERYSYSHLPWNIDWDPITNEIKFL
jgi:3',5'-cyclic AMP phosphodiesterase CpdA